MTFRRRPDEPATPRFVLPLLDLTTFGDADLARLRIRRVVAIGAWTLVLAAGVVGSVVLVARPYLQVIAFAAILGGLICLGLSIGGLVRIVWERRARAFERAVEAHHHPRFRT